MQLFTSATTPFGRKVAVQIIESGLESRVHITAVAGTPLDPGSLPVDLNPLGKIPALLVDGKQAIYDSRVISRYLDQVAAAGLYPEGEALWPVLTLEATADGMLEAAVLMVYEGRLRPEELRYAPWVEAQWAKVSRALDWVEAHGMELLDGPMTMAHVGVGVLLGYLDFRHANRDWRQDRPRLAAWYHDFSQRPAMMRTAPSS